jgi:methyl-accepting chemotaxis protein
VKRVTDVMSEIAAASTEQLSGVEQVSRAVTQMDQVVQQNAGLVAETAAATEKMAAQTEHLVQAVARFRLDSTDGAQDGTSVDAQPAHVSVPQVQKQSGVSA